MDQKLKEICNICCKSNIIVRKFGRMDVCKDCLPKAKKHFEELVKKKCSDTKNISPETAVKIARKVEFCGRTYTVHDLPRHIRDNIKKIAKENSVTVRSCIITALQDFIKKYKKDDKHE